MKILVIGSSGFVGSNLVKMLSKDHQVYCGSRSPNGKDREVLVDLLKRETIATALQTVKPEVIINSAGVIEKGEKAKLNPIFTTNLLEEVVASGLVFKSIVISGSAAEYGLVSKENIPVKESTPLRADSGYGLSKLQETTAALEFKEKHNLPIIIARIFNPIGVGMGPSFLIPRLIEQIKQIQAGEKETIEVSRLDSKRDYLHIDDVSLAIQALIENSPQEEAYNIGSGKSTTNGELIEIILKNSTLEKQPKIVETSKEPESLAAVQADITRLTQEIGWAPTKTIEQTVKEILNATSR